MSLLDAPPSGKDARKEYLYEEAYEVTQHWLFLDYIAGPEAWAEPVSLVQKLPRRLILQGQYL